MALSNSIFVLGSFVGACSVKVDRFPSRGESLRASSFTLEAGGKGFNLAVGARRLGATVDGLIAVGDDLFGDLAGRALAAADLPPGMLVSHAGASGAGVGFVDAGGENCLAVFPGANDQLSAVDVAAADNRLGAAALVLAQFEIGDEPIAVAFARARPQGALTILNPSPYRTIPETVLSQTSLIVANQLEATRLAADVGLAQHNRAAEGDDFEALAGRLIELGLDGLVVTLGAQGAKAWTAMGEVLCQPAFAVRPVDTMGAGDAFTAGLAQGLSSGHGLAESLSRAAACGALTARRRGVLGALPNIDELAAFLREHDTRANPWGDRQFNV